MIKQSIQNKTNIKKYFLKFYKSEKYVNETLR